MLLILDAEPENWPEEMTLEQRPLRYFRLFRALTPALEPIIDRDAENPKILVFSWNTERGCFEISVYPNNQLDWYCWDVKHSSQSSAAKVWTLPRRAKSLLCYITTPDSASSRP